MINFKSMRQYTVVDGIRFPNVEKHFALTYFSENSNFLSDYSKLNIRKTDVKVAIIPTTKIPRTRLTGELLKKYKSLGLKPYTSTVKTPESQNLIFDLSEYLNAIDSSYTPSNYRQRLSNFITNMIDRSFSDYKDYEKVLIYSVDLTKPDLNKFIDSKFFPIFQQLKDDSFSFDHLILCTITPSGAKYRLLMKDKNFKVEKIISYLKQIKLFRSDDEEETDDDNEEINNAVDMVMDKIQNSIAEPNKEKVKSAVNTYLAKDKKTTERISTNSVKPSDMSKIGVASILYKVSGNLKGSQRITNSITKKNLLIH